MDSLNPVPTLHIKTCLFMEEAEAVRMIRDRVFAQEQGIDPALDWDGKDDQSVQLIAELNHQPIGVARLREVDPPPTVKLERLAVLSDYRCQGIGGELVYTAIAYSQNQGYQWMILNAQIQTVQFYKKLGFEPLGQPFEEAGIPHIRMRRPLLSVESVQ